MAREMCKEICRLGMMMATEREGNGDLLRNEG